MTGPEQRLQATESAYRVRSLPSWVNNQSTSSSGPPSERRTGMIFAGEGFFVEHPPGKYYQCQSLVRKIREAGGLVSIDPLHPRVSVIIVFHDRCAPRDRIFSADCPTRSPQELTRDRVWRLSSLVYHFARRVTREAIASGSPFLDPPRSLSEHRVYASEVVNRVLDEGREIDAYPELEVKTYDDIAPMPERLPLGQRLGPSIPTRPKLAYCSGTAHDSPHHSPSRASDNSAPTRADRASGTDVSTPTKAPLQKGEPLAQMTSVKRDLSSEPATPAVTAKRPCTLQARHSQPPGEGEPSVKTERIATIHVQRELPPGLAKTQWRRPESTIDVSGSRSQRERTPLRASSLSSTASTGQFSPKPTRHAPLPEPPFPVPAASAHGQHLAKAERVSLASVMPPSRHGSDSPAAPAPAPPGPPTPVTAGPSSNADSRSTAFATPPHTPQASTSGIFVGSHGLPLTFCTSLCGRASQGLDLLISTYGRGIVRRSPSSAIFILLPLDPNETAANPEHIAVISDTDAAQAVLSDRYIADSLQAGEMLDIAGYRILVE